MNIDELVRTMNDAKYTAWNMCAVPQAILTDLAKTPDQTAVAMGVLQNNGRLKIQEIQMVVSNLLKEMPAKIHKRRRGMSEQYHRRTQKKWNKRYGVGPVAVMMNTQAMRDYFVYGQASLLNGRAVKIML